MSDLDTLLTKMEVADRYSVTTRTIENWVAAGIFPAPIKQSYKCVRWSLASIQSHETTLPLDSQLNSVI